MTCRFRTARILMTSIVVWSIVEIDDAQSGSGAAANADTSAVASPFQDKTSKLRAVERTMTELRAAIESYRNDIADFNAVVALWEVMRKQFQAFEAAATHAQKSCGEYREELKEFQKTYPNQVARFSAIIRECQGVLDQSDTLISEYEKSLEYIRRDVQHVKNISSFTGKSYDKSEAALKAKEAEKQLLDGINKLPGMSGFTKAMPDFKGF